MALAGGLFVLAPAQAMAASAGCTAINTFSGTFTVDSSGNGTDKFTDPGTQVLANGETINYSWSGNTKGAYVYVIYTQNGGTTVAPNTLPQSTAVSGSGSFTFTGTIPGDYLQMGLSNYPPYDSNPIPNPSANGSSVQITVSCSASTTLGVTMAHSGNAVQGGSLAYTITPSISGGATSTATLTAAFTLPSGMTYVSASGTGWTCSGSGQSGSCTRNTSFAAGSGPPITLNTSFASNASSPLTPSTQLSGGGASNTATASDSTSVIATPRVNAIAPTSGPSSGGTSVTITGTGLSGTTSVVFGGTAASGFTINSNTQVTATAPAGTGTVDVRVTTAGGTSATSAADQFVYSDPPATPVVTTPANGATVGSNTPTYSGSSDANVTITVLIDGVSIGTTTATGSGTWSKVQPTALAAGSHTVRAFATNGQSQNSGNSPTNTFTYTPRPVANNYTLTTGITYNAGADTPTAFSIAGQVSNSPTSYAVGSPTTANLGTVSVNNTGVVTYTAARGFRGTDSFTYTASNAGGTSNVATVTITVNNPSLSGTLSGSGTRGATLSNVRVIPSGGTQPYSCSTTLASGALPAGTQLNADCSITGTPTASGTFTFTANLTDSSAPAFTQATGTLTLVVSAPSLTLTPAAGALPGATAGTAYSQTFVAGGGVSPYSYAVFGGALPPGITLSGGTISGTPTAVGSYTFSIRATDSSSAGSGGPYSVANSYSILVAAPAITLSPATLPAGAVGTPYTPMLSATGGNGTYTYTATGTLPPGITLGANGAFSGTPTTGGTFNFTVTAADSGTTGPAAPYGGSRAYTVTIGAPTITVSPASLSAAGVGQPYSAAFSAAGGTAGYNFATAGPLPAGLTLAANGTLSGTPTQGGSFTFTVVATDSSSGTQYTGSRSYTLSIAAPSIVVAPTSLTNPVAGQPYSATVTASGGTGAYTFTTPGGGLPPGLSLASDGTISGTPTGGGTFTFTVIATDSSTGTQYTGSRSYSVNVAPATVVLNPATLPNNAAGTPYSQTLSASGGNGTYSFAVTAGALPPGWSLSPAGVLSGRTTVANVSYTFTVTATDQSVGTPYSGTRSYTVNVSSPNFTLTAPTLGATMGIPYSGNFVAGGGTAPYTYTRAAGTIPPGLTFASDGSLSGTPTTNGTFSFTVIARDSTTGPGSPFGVGSGYTFTVAAPSAPVAGTVNATIAYESSNNAIPLALSGGAATSVAVATPPGHGTAAVSGTAITYTPAAGYFGADSFTYTATNAGGTSAPAIVSITVTAPAAPVAADLNGVSVPYGSTSNAIDLSTSITGVRSSIAAASTPAHGTVSVSGEVVTYTPVASYFGPDSFTYTATGPGGTSTPATVSLTVTTPAAPTAANASANVPFDTGIAIDLSGSITGIRSSIAVASAPAHGTTSVATDVITYTPTAGYYGADSFTYTATGPGGTSATATVSLTVAAPAAPTAAGITGVAVPYDSAGTAIDVSSSVSGVYTSVSVASAPAHGTTSVSGNVITYKPTGGYYGADSFTYTVTGPGGPSAPATINVQVETPAVPTVANVSNVAVPYNSAGTAIDLSSSVNGVHTSTSIAGSPAHGTVTVAGDVVTYVPIAGYFGPDSFTYTATGPGGTSAPASVTLQVEVPAAPAASSVSNVAVTYNSTGTGIDLASSISGVHTSIAIATSPARGTVTASGDVVTYIPAAGYFGIDSFTYTATGPGGTSTPATVTLQVAAPPAPTAASRNDVAVPYNSAGATIDVASDIAGVFTNIAITTGSANGTASISGTVITYIPNTDYFGADSLTYTVTGPGGSSTATIRLNVATPPVPTADNGSASVAGSGSTTSAQSVDIDLSALVDGDYDRIEIRSQPAHGSVSLRSPVARARGIGTLAAPRVTATYTPTPGFTGTDSFTFVAVGPGGTSAPAAVSVEVVGKVPVALPKTAQVGDGQTVSVMLTEGASEGPFTAATIVSVTPAEQATAAIVASGSGASQAYRLDISPAARFSGNVVVIYTLANAYGTSAPSTVTVTVTARPDPSADADVRAISDAQAETTRRFARSQVDNFMRRAEQLHGRGDGSAGARMGVTLNARDSQGMVRPNPGSDAWALDITERMRPSAEDPALGRIASGRFGTRANPAGQLGASRAAAEMSAVDRNSARKASGTASEVQPLVQDNERSDGTRRKGSIAIWTGGSIDIGTQDATTDRSKITATSSGLSAGADVKLAEGITLGLGGGYGNDLTRIAGGAARVRSDTSLIAAYASVTPVDGLFFDGMIGRGDLSFTTRRAVAEVNATALGSRDGNYTLGALAFGIDRQADGFSWSLYGRGEVLDATLGAYVERGASRFDLRFDERSLSSVTGTLGARLELRQKYGFGTVTPRIRGEWNHEFADADAQRLDYADIAGAAFYGIDTHGWTREQFQLGIGSRLVLPSLWTFDFETAFRGAASQRSATLRLQLSKEF